MTQASPFKRETKYKTEYLQAKGKKRKGQDEIT
jgi:hypothetical protein